MNGLTDAGRVDSYYLSLTYADWTQMMYNNPIVGQATNEKIGYQLSTNWEGDVISVGSPYFNNNTGSVSIYS